MKGEVEEHYKTVEQLEQERLEAQRAKEDQKEEEVVEIVEEIVPTKEDELREYLPPKQEEFKRKRQIPVRRNKIVRRFVRRH